MLSVAAAVIQSPTPKLPGVPEGVAALVRLHLSVLIVGFACWALSPALRRQRRMLLTIACPATLAAVLPLLFAMIGILTTSGRVMAALVGYAVGLLGGVVLGVVWGRLLATSFEEAEGDEVP